MAEVVGRERELTLVDEFLAIAGRRFGVLVFEGEAGIGKTTVWREAIRHASDEGFRVLSSRPGQMETKLAFSSVADLLETVPDELFASLVGPQRRALEVALLRAEPGLTPLEPRLIATAFRSLLEALRDEGRVLVAVDDLQWLDSASEMVIQFALRRLSGRPIGWLFTHRVTEPLRLTADGPVAADSLTRVTVGPLTLAALHHVLGDRLERSLTRPMLTRVHRSCRGNPLYALEITRELLRTGDSTATRPMPVPEDLRELISRRVRQLPEPTRDALLACAALSEPTTALVEERALVAAEEAEIVSLDGDGRIAFRHPLYASAVYASASQTRRREMHARLAELVGDVEERARHLALAGDAPDERIAHTLEEGAALARSRGAWESASELLEQAARLTPRERPEEIYRRVIGAAEHHAHAGNRARARALVERILAEALSRPQRADALRLLGEIGHHEEDFVEARRRFAEALDYADDPRVAVASELGIAYTGSYLLDFEGSRLHTHRALELAEQIGDPGPLAEALGYSVMWDYLCGDGVDWDRLERSLALEDPTRVVPLQSRPSVIAGCLLLYVGRHSEARGRLLALRTTLAGQGDESDLAQLLMWISWLETRSGNLNAAADLADEAVSNGGLTGSQLYVVWSQLQRGFVHAHQGEVEEARQACAVGAAFIERSGTGLLGLWIAASLALIELSLGNPQAAWLACESLTQALEQRGIGEPVPAFFLPDALEALIALGELDRAGALLDGFEQRGRELDRAWALATASRCRGLLLAARGDVAGAARALERALAEHERIELPFERARVLLAKGAVERRARQRTRAKATLEQALCEFERIGAPLFAERARDELSRVGLRRSDGSELTASERRVAELAAAGRTNREIAAELFVSPKTVEANLGRAYRKLGIRSRAQLGSHIAKQPQT